MSAVMRGNLRIALGAIRSAKWRSVLTMLGVIVGIVAVVTVVGIGEGIKRQVAGQLNHFGHDLITVRPGQHDRKGTIQKNDSVFGMAHVGGLTMNDLITIKDVAGIQSVAPLGMVSGKVEAGGNSIQVPIVATDAQLPSILRQPISVGEFWSSAQEGAKVAVVGRNVAHKLFNETVPLGQSFTFRGQTFIVRGMFEPFKQTPFSATANFDDAIFISSQTAFEVTDQSPAFYAILARPAKAEQMHSKMKAIAEALERTHGGQKDFTVLSPTDVVANSNSVVDLLTTWIAAVAAISLFIGGVGIMNIMLLTVTERMHEIGVRKAIGATGRQILGQFLLEAAVLSVVGGIIGVVLSLAIDGLLFTYTDLKPVISWRAIVIATGVSLAIGIVFGVAPAIKAARKDPIEALRHE
jgi:putative ABC transport system permease protein